MKYLITGGTGFIGTYYVSHLLKNGHQVTVLSRSARDSKREGLHFAKWDGRSISDDLGTFDVLLNLAGAGIAEKRWTDFYKNLLIDSRVYASRACVEWINRQSEKPKVFLAGSAIGYYGADPGIKELDENGPVGSDFMAEVCQKWEEASDGAEVRTVNLRTGVVLGRDGGPLKEIMKPYALYLGGPIASGRQGFPWVHIADWIKMVDFLVENENIKGPVNLVAPAFTNHQRFSNALAKVLHKPNFFPVPKFMLNLLLGESAVVAWGGYNLLPKVLLDEGYKWEFPEIREALEDIIKG